MNMKEDLFKELLYFDLHTNVYLGDQLLIEKAHTGSKLTNSYLQANWSEYFSISLIYGSGKSHKSETGSMLPDEPGVLLREKGELNDRVAVADRQFIALYFSQAYLDNENLPWNDYLNRVFVNSLIPLTEAELGDFHSYFKLIMYEYQKNDAKAPAVIANLLMIVFKMIIHLGTKTTPVSDSHASRSAYFQFKALIEQHFNELHHVQAYADLLNMTAEMLGKAVKDTVNKTPKQVIDERLIAEAKKLLAWTDISNKGIAYHLGFESDSYFNRYFKKHCQQTPLNYRQCCRTHNVYRDLAI